MTLDMFWQRIESAICEYNRCRRAVNDWCPVQEYANETNTERMCDKVCDCAEGLMMLHKKLQSEERKKIGLTAAREKVRTEFP